MLRSSKKIFFIAVVFFTLLFSGEATATNGNAIDFNIDKNFDISARSQISTVLVKTTTNLYFYVEKLWWDQQPNAKQNEILANLDSLSVEFSSKIYPVLTSIFGSEWKPGVDGDTRIYILFHSMKEEVGGYVRSNDEYLKIQLPDSNEKEMLYLSVAQIDQSRLKVFVAHEFVHVITFNQKDKIRNVQEEVWLNEARSEYAATILGYNTLFEGSVLQRRVKDFLENPTDSLTEWQESKHDYAAASLFIHYLVDHYGISILSDSLGSKAAGIAGLNEALAKNGAKENVSQIFTNWTIATFLNDCAINLHYCYLTPSLKNLRINSTLNFLPLTGNSSLSVTNITKNWAANWQKIIGGNGNLKLEFSSLAGLDFKVPYIVFDKNGSYVVGSFLLNKDQKGQIIVSDFGSKNSSLIIIPSLQTKTAGFNGAEPTYPYSFTATITGENFPPPPPPPPTPNICSQITRNLSIGLFGNDVRCLQQFLKNQAGIYPEGLVTGYFGRLTKAAVTRFQEKYASEILSPIGLSRGTGFFGPLTRAKINSLLSAPQ